MKALLLAAGYGTRLRELTTLKPKCLIKVGEETMLDHWIIKLEKLGVDQFIINTHYLSTKVENHITDYHPKKNITLSYEKELLGTAGTLKKHASLLKDDFCFVIHVDNFCEDNLENFLKSHSVRPKNTIFSMLTFNTKSPETCGIVEVDKNNCLIAFHEKQSSPPSNKANAAVYLLTKKFFDEFATLSLSGNDISNCIIPKFINRIYCIHTEKYFEDIGTPQSLARANQFLLDRKLR